MLYKSKIRVFFQIKSTPFFITKSQKRLHNNIINTLKSVKNIIKYFDKYHLQSTKFIDYIKWRKIYQLIQYNNYKIKNLSRIIR